MVFKITFNSCVILGKFNTLYLHLLAILSWPLAYDWATFAINGCPVTQPEGGAFASNPCSLDDLCPIGTTRTRSWGGCRSRHHKGWPSWLKSNQVFCLDTILMGFFLTKNLFILGMKPA